MRIRLAPLVASGLLLCNLTISDAHADVPAVRLAHAIGGAPWMMSDATGRIPVTLRLPAGVPAETLDLLPIADGLGGARFTPSELDAFTKAHPELRPLFAPPRRTQLDQSSKWTSVDVYRKATGATGKGVIVGIIDTGIDVGHPDFRDAKGKSRVRWMLQHGQSQGIHGDLETKFGCNQPAQSACAVFDNNDIDKMIASKDFAIHDVEGHGSHVSSIAAGNGGPFVNKKPRYVGMAPDATIIVAAPSAPGAGFYDPDLLNAARFIFDRADELGMPCVINLSIGGDFGPHDGTSVLEQGLASLVGDDKPGRAIVVAAGNSGALYQLPDLGPLGTHTEAHVSPSTDVRVPMIASDAKKGSGYVWITFRPGDDVSVSLEGPGGATWIGFVSPGEDAGYKNGDDTGGVINDEISSKSPITEGTNSAVVAFSGAWPNRSEFAVHLRGHGEAELWVVGQGDVGPSAPIGLLFEHGLKQGTINVPASDPHLLAVGCTLNRVSWKPFNQAPIALSSLGGKDDPLPDSACYFSAVGPTPFGVAKPELSAPGGFVIAAMSSEADPRVNPGGMFDQGGCPTNDKCYVVDNYHAITAGTSMSAPHVAGAVALLFEKDPKLTQARVTEILQAGVRHPTGDLPIDFQLGPGELNLEGALEVLAEQAGVPLDVDAAKSWYVMSSAYARPDASFPVWGTIELRRPDGAVATGLDGTKLRVRVTGGGSIIKPLTKVRGGLFRFAVAGSRGAGGSDMHVEVLYDGVSLGEKTLPIGEDLIAARGGVDATSASLACATSPGRGSHGALYGVGLFAALAAVRRRRRSRARRG